MTHVGRQIEYGHTVGFKWRKDTGDYKEMSSHWNISLIKWAELSASSVFLQIRGNVHTIFDLGVFHLMVNYYYGGLIMEWNWCTWNTVCFAHSNELWAGQTGISRVSIVATWCTRLPQIIATQNPWSPEDRYPRGPLPVLQGWVALLEQNFGKT